MLKCVCLLFAFVLICCVFICWSYQALSPLVFSNLSINKIVLVRIDSVSLSEFYVLLSFSY